MKKIIYIAISLIMLVIILIVSKTLIIEKDKKEIVEEINNINELNNESQNIEEVKEEEIFDNSKIGTLTIPKINLENIDVCENVELDTLSYAIGHFENTSIYEGNVGLASHNAGTNANYFADINKLVAGDEIYYKTRFGTKKYIVDTSIEIDSYNWDYLKPTEDNRITLITCISGKPNMRLCVQAIEQ